MDSSTAAGGGHRQHEEDAVLDLSRDADLLINEHGDDADVVAAHRADSLFRRGDTFGAERWSKIFRMIAASHLRQA